MSEQANIKKSIRYRPDPAFIAVCVVLMLFFYIFFDFRVPTQHERRRQELPILLSPEDLEAQKANALKGDTDAAMMLYRYYRVIAKDQVQADYYFALAQNRKENNAK